MFGGGTRGRGGCAEECDGLEVIEVRRGREVR